MTSVDERADAQETFNLFDKDQDGKISLDELRTAMMAICGRATEEDIARILKVEVDKKRLKTIQKMTKNNIEGSRCERRRRDRLRGILCSVDKKDYRGGYREGFQGL